MKLTAFIASAIALCATANAMANPPGYPEREHIHDLESKFRTPPSGYGEVPFYWWIGDTLTRDHLEWELDKLSGRHISSLQINYCHRDTGGIIYGLTYPSQPALFSEQWWDLFGWFMDEAGKRGITVSLSDYTLGPGQGSYVDRMLHDNPALNGYELRFDTVRIASGERFRRVYDDLPLSLNAYRIASDGTIENPHRPYRLLETVLGRSVDWRAPADVMVTQVSAVRKAPSVNPMHPLSGISYVNHFFQTFEDHFPGKAGSGLNFFFSDELNFALDGNIWSDNYRDEFRRRKSYDIVPVLDALFIDLGDETPKIRLDYNDVRVALSGEYFFKPLYDWHDSRGLLFGCDHGGRGKDVGEFGDYFRTQRWNQAPGCDQPFLQSDIVKNKVASSIAHLYNRPRVWLEGFHSSGWGTNSAQLTDAIFSNFVQGHNLLSLHGLYYTTKGGRWEWAPPCNHFHEPYWVDMESLMECSERLSYLLSQGYHAADVAVLYPVEPVVAGYGDSAVNAAFKAGETLYRDGIDFDFMDYESLARAKVSDGALSVSGERYRVFVVPSMQAIRHASLEKIRDFAARGGVVVNIGAYPEATDREGRAGSAMRRLLKDIFHRDRPNVKLVADAADVAEVVGKAIPRDFTVLSGSAPGSYPSVMHRRFDGRDLYAVYNVPRGSLCRFRAEGGVTLLDPYTGDSRPLPVESVGGGSTVVRMPLDSTEIHLLLFDHKVKPEIAATPDSSTGCDTIAINGKWAFRVDPVLDNSYGDFHWPGTPGMLGVYAYGADFRRLDRAGVPVGQPRYQTFGYGDKFMMLATAEDDINTIAARKPSPRNSAGWQPYDFSWRWGVENDCGHQGWHGLKGEIDDNFIRLGRLEREFNGTVRRPDSIPGLRYYMYTHVLAPADGDYTVEWGGATPQAMLVNGRAATPGRETISLSKGMNEILLKYDTHGTGRFAVRSGSPAYVADLAAERPLTMKYRGDASLLLFDSRADAASSAAFSFRSAPGLEAIEFTAFGRPSVSADSIPCVVECVATRADGAARYRATLPGIALHGAGIDIVVPETWGYSGGAIIDGPIAQICGKGFIEAGDWCSNESLRTYSGAAVYSKTINIGRNLPANAVIDLGKVVSSAKVTVNGVDAGTRLAPPYRFDITALLKEGNNDIEVRVANTAANFYLTVPTTYGGDTTSGLIGPVTLISEGKKN